MHLQAGGCAGFAVDLVLFPIDTVKTRLQSQQGFLKAGGFRGVYSGLPSVAVGSIPNGKYCCDLNMSGLILAHLTHRSSVSSEGCNDDASLCIKWYGCKK